MADFKSGVRTTSVPQQIPPQLMIKTAKGITDAEIEQAAAYFSGLKPRGVIKVTAGPAVEFDVYTGFTGPTSFGSSSDFTAASSSSGDFVGIYGGGGFYGPTPQLDVPFDYVSGTPLSDTATYDNATFTSLGVTPGTYEWTWGSGATADSFTLQIGAVPAPPIGRGLPVLLAVGGLLFGAKLLERGKRRKLQFDPRGGSAVTP